MKNITKCEMYLNYLSKILQENGCRIEEIQALSTGSQYTHIEISRDCVYKYRPERGFFKMFTFKPKKEVFYREYIYTDKFSKEEEVDFRSFLNRVYSFIVSENVRINKNNINNSIGRELQSLELWEQSEL